MLVNSNLNKIMNFQCSNRILHVNLHQLKHQTKTLFNNEFQIIGGIGPLCFEDRKQRVVSAWKGVSDLFPFDMRLGDNLLPNMTAMWHEKLAPFSLFAQEETLSRSLSKSLQILAYHLPSFVVEQKNLSISILTTFGLKEFEYSKGWMPEFSLLRLVCMSKWPDRGRTD